MEDEKVGEVKRAVFSALKRDCQEYPIDFLISTRLRRLQEATNKRVKERDKIPMFTEKTRKEYLNITSEELEYFS